MAGTKPGTGVDGEFAVHRKQVCFRLLRVEKVMGQKVNPVGFRTGIMVPHKSRWYASKKEFSALLLEDFKIRNFIKKHPKKNYAQAGIDRIEIERTRDEVKIVLYVARPGLIIGKKGQDVEILQEELQRVTDAR